MELDEQYRRLRQELRNLFINGDIKSIDPLKHGYVLAFYELLFGTADPETGMGRVPPALLAPPEDGISFEEIWDAPAEALPDLHAKWDAQVKQQWAQITGQDELFHLLDTTAISAEDRTKVAFYPSCDATKMRRTSWAKYLRGLSKYGIVFPNAIVERLQAQLSTLLDDTAWSYRVVRGSEVREIYDNVEFGDSCMTGGTQSGLYAENPDKVGVLAIYRAGNPYGRALLWNTDEGEVYLDRIYPSDGGAHYHWLCGVAAKEGWVTRNGNGIGGKPKTSGALHVTLKDVGEYPYMDTFAGIDETPYDRNDGKFVLTTGAGMCDYEMNFTDNTCPWDEESNVELLCGDMLTQRQLQRNLDRGEVIWDDNAGGYDWASNFVEPLNRDEMCSIHNHHIERVWDHDNSEWQFLYVSYYSNINSALEDIGYRQVPNQNQTMMMHPEITQCWAEDNHGDTYFTCDCSYCADNNRKQAEQDGYVWIALRDFGEFERVEPEAVTVLEGSNVEREHQLASGD